LLGIPGNEVLLMQQMFDLNTVTYIVTWTPITTRQWYKSCKY